MNKVFQNRAVSKNKLIDQLDIILQALVRDIRTVWNKINTFDIGKLQQFLNPKPVFA